jgi:multiple sugar transport system ATP-binding protein
MADVAGVTVDGVEKTYPGADRKALERISLEIPPGSFFSILGPSGCGKTTLLRILAGFEKPTAGRVLIGGDDVTDIPPRSRDIAMVFQDYALYPHMTVRQNITFNLVNRSVPAAEIARRLGETAGMLGIERHLAKYPGQLSGGERQRVALGRALIRKPRVFLMDEPLSNLDLKLREAMRLELGRLHQRLGITIIYVTHDQVEAMTLSTAVAVMNDGVLQQVDRPETVYAAPANTFVAKFIGSPSTNLFNATYADGAVCLAGPNPISVRLPYEVPLRDGTPVTIGVRPHELVFQPPGAERLPVRVSFTERMGRSNFVVCTLDGAEATLAGSDAVQVETGSDVSLSPDSVQALAFKPEAIRLFAADGAAIGRLTPSERPLHRANG